MGNRKIHFRPSCEITSFVATQTILKLRPEHLSIRVTCSFSDLSTVYTYTHPHLRLSCQPTPCNAAKYHVILHLAQIHPFRLHNPSSIYAFFTTVALGAVAGCLGASGTVTSEKSSWPTALRVKVSILCISIPSMQPIVLKFGQYIHTAPTKVTIASPVTAFLIK